MDPENLLIPHYGVMTLMIMNTGRNVKKYLGNKPAEWRKQAIYEIVRSIGAALVLVQEFEWKDIRSRAWKRFDWPEYLQYTGSYHAGIIYDINEVIIEEYPATLLLGTIEELQRTGSIQQGFAPIPRMCIRKITTKGVPAITFICISWHGRHNRAKLDDLKEEFKCLMKYVLKLVEKVGLPVIIAGDFNIKIKDIEELVPPTLKLYKYDTTGRRDENEIIDYFISSKYLVMTNMRAEKLELTTRVENVLSLFDHDPVITNII